MGDPEAAPGMHAVTISRSYGSGGGEIAARLARRLNWQLIDHEVVARIAHQLGITTAEAEERDEHVEGLVSRLLNGMHLAVPEAPVAVPALPGEREETYFEALRQVIESAANEGRVVIVGRAGQVLLANRRDTLHVRIVAPLERRIVYVARREGLSETRARERIQLKDRDRTRYLQSRYHCHPDDPLYYDLMITTGVLDLDSAVELVLLALEHKARTLALPHAGLGPAAGLSRYPGEPADLPPPDADVDGPQ